MKNSKLLTCPVRGPLSVEELASDGLTLSEEARRIELIGLLLDRDYPKENISVETVVIKDVGEKGRSKVRADLVVYDVPSYEVETLENEEKFSHAIIVAEVKRDQKSKKSGIKHQLEPALRMLPSMSAIGIYWDDIHQLLFAKVTKGKPSDVKIIIEEDNIANLPRFGTSYKAKPLTLSDLRPASNFMGVLRNIANVFRSHKINNESDRYRETVKLILARYCDERAAKSSVTKQLMLQVLPGKDLKFMERVLECYGIAAKRYHRAETLFSANDGAPQLSEDAMREIVSLVQGINFSAASSEVMQQVFMSFVPAVFKKSLDQYFTPLSLIDAMVNMSGIGPNDNIADPAMGTADFLSSAMAHRMAVGDDDVVNRVYGADADKTAFDLAIVNMILHKDGQSNFENEDSIENYNRWKETIDVALCNPPFGAKSVEKRPSVLKQYDLGHVWKKDDAGNWMKSDKLASSQQLGILFIEKCVKMLSSSGRVAIILPEGYLCTTSYGYVRRWILDNLRVLALVELPRRMFTRSDADLRANIMVAQKLEPDQLDRAKDRDYPIHAELIRKIGVKMGKGFSTIPKRDELTGVVLRNDENIPMVDSDFLGLQSRYNQFRIPAEVDILKKGKSKIYPDWKGARLSDIENHSNLDLKPRRLSKKACILRKKIKDNPHFFLKDVAAVVTETLDLQEKHNFNETWRLVEGSSVRAVEGTVVPHEAQRAWQIIEGKQRKVFHLQDNDIVIGLVRPERRNVGLLLDDSKNLVGTPDGIAVVRVNAHNNLDISQEYLFQVLRSEISRIQLWTESGGTSYGKLNHDHILNLRLPTPTKTEHLNVTDQVSEWKKGIRLAQKTWADLGAPEDRVPIVNSPMLGLEPE